MKITFIAQSGFIIETSSSCFSIDLWLDNPLHAIELQYVPKLDYVFVTHDHFDHGLLDAIKISQRDKAIFISSKDIEEEVKKTQNIQTLHQEDPIDKYNTKDLTVHYVSALHSSDTGDALGFIIEFEGHTIYHMGDTAYMKDFKYVGREYDIDLLMIPIGSYYTMDPQEAAQAVQDIKPRNVIPMHYNTFDKIKQEPKDFADLIDKSEVKTKVIIMKPGASITLKDHG